MTEQWRPVVGYEGLYEVSDQGRVRSLDRYVNRQGGLASGRPMRVRGRMRRLYPAKGGGYPSVSLSRDGVLRSWTAHRLVMEAFVGPLPEGMEIRHLDGDPQNSQLDNLRYGTPSENMMDKQRHGTDHQANKTHCPRGHAYDDVNTYVLPSRPRARYCHECRRIHQAAMRLRAGKKPRIRNVRILQDGI